ncbi:hypothetical protein Tco_0909515 [Tanacetum coccineum]|uniref:Uncharacterized protein n=1 Tax=Tanacetum coccineum TaxID=301880 RepID=A0ABQ5CQD5_9ASTR
MLRRRQYSGGEGQVMRWNGGKNGVEGLPWAACKSLACIRLCPRGQSCLHAPSTCCGPDVCDIRTSYVSHQCTSSDGDSAAPCLLRRLTTPDWLTLAS